MIGLLVYFGIRYQKTVKEGKEITVGVNPDLGIVNIDKQNFDEIDADSDKEATEVTEDNSQSDKLEAFVFEVPKTCLPPVEDITGSNWYDDNLYSPIDEIPEIRYFSKVVFVGDSRTEGLVLYSGLPNINGFCYKALGIDKLEDDACILVDGYSGKYTCFDAISMTKYDGYYLSFGVNELGWVSVSSFIDCYNKLIDHIISVNPDAVIYVQNILPVSKKKSDGSSIYNMEKVNEFNAAILEMCMQRKDVIYLDVASVVTDADGYLPAEASSDGIHCNDDYCKRIIQYIRRNIYIKK